MERDAKQIDHKLLDALERLGEAMRTLKEEAAREYGLTPLQVRVLLHLMERRSEEPSSSELARDFGLTRATTGEVIKTLMEKGLLERDRSTRDRRRYALRLTKQGDKLSQRVSGYTEALEAPLADMEKGEKEALLHSTLSIIHGLIRQGVVSVQRMCYTCRFYRQSKGEGYCELLDLIMDEPRVDCRTHEKAEELTP